MKLIEYKDSDSICEIVDVAISKFERYYLKDEYDICTCIQGWSDDLFNIIDTFGLVNYHYSYIIGEHFELIKEIISKELVSRYNLDVNSLEISKCEYDYGECFGSLSHEIYIEYNKLGLKY